MTTVSHEEARRPDVVTQQLKKGFEWSTQHSKAAIAVAAVILLVLGGYFGARAYSMQKEERLQGELYLIEKDYLSKKEKFDAYERNQLPAGHPPQAADAEKGEKPSGDLAKDYGDLSEKFAKFAEAHPGTVAGTISAIYASEIYEKYGKPELSLKALETTQSQSGLAGVLAMNRLATGYANAKDCAKAMGVWNKIISDSTARFIHPEVKLRTALCAESTGDVATAERLYKEVSEGEKDSSHAQTAAQLLRYLKVKKN